MPRGVPFVGENGVAPGDLGINLCGAEDHPCQQQAEQKAAAGDTDAVALLTGMSPVAWRHINLTGAFDFSASASPINLDAVAARYADPETWRRSVQKEDAEDSDS